MPEARSVTEIFRNSSGVTRANGVPLRFSQHKFSGDRGNQEFFAVDYGVYRVSVINRFDEVADAFDKEQSMIITIAPIFLKLNDLR